MVIQNMFLDIFLFANFNDRKKPYQARSFYHGNTIGCEDISSFRCVGGGITRFDVALFYGERKKLARTRAISELTK
jgi:hypothetical protein